MPARPITMASPSNSAKTLIFEFTEVAVEGGGRSGEGGGGERRGDEGGGGEGGGGLGGGGGEGEGRA